MTPLDIALLVWALLATYAARRNLAGWKAALAGWREAVETLARVGEVMEEEGAALAAIQEAIDAAQSGPHIDAHEIRKDLMN